MASPRCCCCSSSWKCSWKCSRADTRDCLSLTSPLVLLPATLSSLLASEGGRHAGRCKRRCRCCRSPLLPFAASYHCWRMLNGVPAALLAVDFRDHKFGINIFITQSKNTKRKPPKTCCKRLRIDLHDVRAQKYKTFLLVSKEATASHRTPQNSPVHLSRRSSRKVWSDGHSILFEPAETSAIQFRMPSFQRNGNNYEQISTTADVVTYERTPQKTTYKPL